MPDDENDPLGYANRDSIRQPRRRWWSHFVWIMPAWMLAWLLSGDVTSGMEGSGVFGYLSISSLVNVISAAGCVALLIATRARSRRAIVGLILIAAWVAYPVSPFIYLVWKASHYPPYSTPRELDPKTGEPLDRSGP